MNKKLLASMIAVMTATACTTFDWQDIYFTSERPRGYVHTTVADTDGNIYVGGGEIKESSAEQPEKFLIKYSASGSILYKIRETCANFEVFCWVSGILPDGDFLYEVNVEREVFDMIVRVIKRNAADGSVIWSTRLPPVNSGSTVNEVSVKMKLVGGALLIQNWNAIATALGGATASINTADGVVNWMNGPSVQTGDKTIYPDARAGDWEVAPNVNSETAEILRHDGGLYADLDSWDGQAGVQRIRGAGRLGNDLVVFGDAIAYPTYLVAQRLSPTDNGFQLKEQITLNTNAVFDHVVTATSDNTLCFASKPSWDKNVSIQIGGVRKDSTTWQQTINSLSGKQHLQLMDVKATGNECIYVYNDLTDDVNKNYQTVAVVSIKNATTGKNVDQISRTGIRASTAHVTTSAIVVAGQTVEAEYDKSKATVLRFRRR